MMSLRIAPTIAFENWRFSPGSYLYMESRGERRHSIDPLFGIALAALILKMNQSEPGGFGELIGLAILGGLTCLPNAEYVAPITFGGIRPSIMWSYNLLPLSWSAMEIGNVKKIGMGLRKRMGGFDLAAHAGVSDQGFGEKPGPTFGLGCTFFIGRFGLPGTRP